MQFIPLIEAHSLLWISDHERGRELVEYDWPCHYTWVTVRVGSIQEGNAGKRGHKGSGAPPRFYERYVHREHTSLCGIYTMMDNCVAKCIAQEEVYLTENHEDHRGGELFSNSMSLGDIFKPC